MFRLYFCTACSPLDSSMVLNTTVVVFGKHQAIYSVCVLPVICSFPLKTVTFSILLSLFFLSFCSFSLPYCNPTSPSPPRLPADSWITMYQCSARNWLPNKIMFCLILGCCSVMRANSVWHWEQEKNVQVWPVTKVTRVSICLYVHSHIYSIRLCSSTWIWCHPENVMTESDQ